MTKRPARNIVALTACGLFAAVSFLLSGCGREAVDAYARVEADRTPLIDGFESYATAAEVRHKLEQSRAVPAVVEDSRLPAGDTRPRFDVLVLEVRGFSHLGHVGDLKLAFLNDRLAATQFFPRKPDSYLKALQAHGESVSEAASVRGNTSLVTYTAYDGRQYVRWSDVRIDEEQKRWIMKYS